MSAHPTRSTAWTYCRLVVERTDVGASYARRDPLREEFARLVEVHVRPNGVRVDDGEVPCSIVDLGGDRTFWHVLDAFSRVDDAETRPERVEDVGEGRGGRQG